MRLRVFASLLLLVLPVFQLAGQPTSNPEKFSPPSRTFRFTYSFTVKDIPPGTKMVRVWVPVAQSDEHQTVRLVETKSAAKTQIAREPEYGNKILYVALQNPTQGTASFTLVYEVTRKEFSRGDYAQLERQDSMPGLVPASMTRFVESDQLIPT
ncbi:MAG: hypothetical protein WAN69_13360, partial [Candidatus Korobacteraceae bacterium]